MQHALCSRAPSGLHLCGFTPDPTTVSGWRLLTWQQGMTAVCQAAPALKLCTTVSCTTEASWFFPTLSLQTSCQGCMSDK